MRRSNVDWDALEPHYRAGIRSLKDIGDQFGVSDAGIIKHAREFGWTRNLKEKIRAAADAKVSAAMVSASVCAAKKQTEAVLVDVESEVQKRIRLEHRADITRMRSLVKRLLSECEAEAADPGLFEHLGELMENPDNKGLDKLNEAYRKAISLPQRIKGVKELAESLRVLVALEREAYGIAAVEPAKPDDKPQDMTETARQVAFLLAAGLRQATG